MIVEVFPDVIAGMLVVKLHGLGLAIKIAGLRW